MGNELSLKVGGGFRNRLAYFLTMNTIATGKKTQFISLGVVQAGSFTTISTN